MNDDEPHLVALERVTYEFGDVQSLLRSHDRLLETVRCVYTQMGGNATKYAKVRYDVMSYEDDRMRVKPVTVDIGELCRILEGVLREDEHRRRADSVCDKGDAKVGGKYRTGGRPGPKVAKGKSGG